MSAATALSNRQQIIGRRPGLEPYYAIAEQSSSRVLLQSHPRANTKAGGGIAVRGAIMVVLAILLLYMGFVSSAPGAGGGLGVLLVLLIIGGVLGGMGVVRIVGGLAVATTENIITIDAEQGVIEYTQTNRIARPRTQTLSFGSIGRLQLRPRLFVTAGWLSRRYRIVALELVTDKEQIWLVDSAVSLEAITPAANALATILDRDIEVVEATNETGQA